MQLEQMLTTIPNESVSVVSNQLSTEVVSPERFVEIVRNDELLKSKLIQHKNEYETFVGILQRASLSIRKTVKYGRGLFATISALIKDVFPDVNLFTSAHEDILLDYIFIDIYGWHPTNAEFWFLDKHTRSIRANRFAFQDRVKNFGKEIVTMVRKVRRELLKSRLLTEFKKASCDVLNTSSVSSNSEASSSSNILSMNVQEIEQDQEESMADIETSDVLTIHKAIGGFLQLQDDDTSTGHWEFDQIKVFRYK
jgi:hypothetical protein